MARKLNSEETQNFHDLLAEAEFSGDANFETLANRLREKSQAKLELSASLGFWFGDDVSNLPRT
jgi:hypothetical protein